MDGPIQTQGLLRPDLLFFPPSLFLVFLATHVGMFASPELRLNPPNVEVDNTTYNDRTVLTVDSANRAGTLVEVGTSAWFVNNA